MTGKFSEFVESTKRIDEARGVSVGVANMPISEPLANLVSLIPGRTLRSRALNWLMTEGLMKASEGRERLLKLVQSQLGAGTVSKPAPPPYARPQGAAKVVGEMAREVLPLWGRDEDEDITSQDLFSPEAWERHPELASVRIDGLSIPEYYEKNFEPKKMILEGSPGSYLEVSMSQMRGTLEAHGLKPFRYGGHDGYIQYVEKGSYLPPHKKQVMYSPNGQQGIDLRPEKTVGPDKQTEVDVPDQRGFDNKGNPVWNFAGGSVSQDEKRAEQTIDRMQHHFNNVADAVRNNDPLAHYDPRDVEYWKNILVVKNLFHRAENDVMAKGGGSRNVLKKLGVPNTGKGPLRIPLPDIIEPETFEAIMRNGLAQPMEKDAKGAFKNPSAFGPEWNGNGPQPPDGWHMYSDSGKQIVKMNKRQIDDIMAYVMKDFEPSQRIIHGRWNSAQIPSLKATEPKTNSRQTVSAVFDEGANSDPELLQGMKAVLYRIKGLNPQQFVRKLASDKIEVNPLDPYDPKLLELRDRGYNWELRTPKQRKEGHPFIDKTNDVGFLVMKGSRYMVKRDRTNPEAEKFYLLAPRLSNGKPYKPPTHGDVGSAWLGATNTPFSGGIGGGHVNANVAGKKMFGQLIQRLQNGEFGEPGGPYAEVTDLPSIRHGVQTSKNYFFKKTDIKWPEDNKSQSELYTWGYEALRAFSNNPAFQIGYTSKDEMEHILGNFKKEKEIEDETFYGGGRGIHALLHRRGVDDPEAQEELIDFINSYRTGSNQFFSVLQELPPAVAEAFGENAFEARKRQVAGFVFGRMMREAKQRFKDGDINFSGMKGAGDDAQEFDTAGSGHAEKRSGNWGDKDRREFLPPEKLGAVVGMPPQPIADEPAPAPAAAPAKTAPAATPAAPKVNQPTEPKPAAVPKPSKAVAEPTAKPTPKPIAEPAPTSKWGFGDALAKLKQGAAQPQAQAQAPKPSPPQPQQQQQARQTQQVRASQLFKAKLDALKKQPSATAPAPGNMKPPGTSSIAPGTRGYHASRSLVS